MSRRQYAAALRARLRALNDRIDRAVIAGRSYTADARAHAATLRALRRLA